MLWAVVEHKIVVDVKGTRTRVNDVRKQSRLASFKLQLRISPCFLFPQLYDKPILHLIPFCSTPGATLTLPSLPPRLPSRCAILCLCRLFASNAERTDAPVAK